MPETFRSPALANEPLTTTHLKAAHPATDLNIPVRQLGVDSPVPPDDVTNLGIRWDHLWNDMVEPWRLGDFQYDFTGT